MARETWVWSEHPFGDISIGEPTGEHELLVDHPRHQGDEIDDFYGWEVETIAEFPTGHRVIVENDKDANTRVWLVEPTDLADRHLTDVGVEIVPEEDPDPSYLEQEGFEDRLAQYRRGDFRLVGIRAVATVVTRNGDMSNIDRVTSPGLWSVESDSTQAYLEEVAREELAELRAELKQSYGLFLPADDERFTKTNWIG